VLLLIDLSPSNAISESKDDAMRVSKLWLLSMIILVGVLHGEDSLVTRDDFLCFDSSFMTVYDCDVGSDWPGIAIDSRGRLYEIDRGRLNDSGATSALDYNYQFGRFDANGNLVENADVFQPFTDFGDTVWAPHALARIYCNDSGNVFLPHLSQPYIGTQTAKAPQNFFEIHDPDGGLLAGPLCVSCDFPHENYIHFIPSGGINSAGVVGAAWMIERSAEYGYDNGIIARMYFPDDDSLGPFIRLDTLPNPLLGDPLWSGSDPYARDMPAMAVADDNSFAVAWGVSTRDTLGQARRRLMYAVFNSDYTVRRPVSLVDCEGGYFESELCASPAPHDLTMAMEPDGDFYISWSAYNEVPYYNIRWQVWVRGFHSDGTPKYPAVRVNDCDSTNLFLGQLLFTGIACDTAGDVLVSWSDGRFHAVENEGLSNKRQIFAQKIDAEGNLIGPNYPINNTSGFIDLFGVNQFCALNDAGQAVFIWRELTDTSKIMAQLMPYDKVGTFLPGDVNLDFSANIADPIFIIQIIFTGRVHHFWPPDLPDANNDGSYGNIADAVYLINYIFKNGPEPHTPYQGIRPPLGWMGSQADMSPDAEDNGDRGLQRAPAYLETPGK
jgi:hypothetical protein